VTAPQRKIRSSEKRQSDAQETAPICVRSIFASKKDYMAFQADMCLDPQQFSGISQHAFRPEKLNNMMAILFFLEIL
jgi:hypothetical protein